MPLARLVPRIDRLHWWRGRTPATVAGLCVLLFVSGGLIGWWRVEGRTATGSWGPVTVYGEYLDGNPPPGDAAVVFGMTWLLPCAVAWVWAPFGGHVGRLATVAAFGLALLLTTQFPAPQADGAMPDALLGQDGWEWHGLDGTRPLPSLTVAEPGTVAFRERVQPGVLVSFVAAAGGLAMGAGSLLGWLVSVWRATVRRVRR